MAELTLACDSNRSAGVTLWAFVMSLYALVCFPCADRIEFFMSDGVARKL
jgi:hypothetical protein